MKSDQPTLNVKTLVVFSLLATPAFSQAVAPATPASDATRPNVPVQSAQTANESEGDEAVVLTPFEVNASDDRGYQTTETLAGTRIRTDLKDVGGALSVYTREFMRDIGATDNSTLLQYTTGSEVAGVRGTYAGLGNGTSVDETANLRAPGGAQRVRGLAAADNTRDFFVTDIPWDSFNTDRIDLQRGPNSILFGLGSPAGIINASTRNATYKNGGSVEGRFGSYGTLRGSLDYNQVLIPKTLAIRVDGLLSHEKYKQEPAFQRDKRIYGALRFDPKLFSDSAQTSFKVKFESGDIKANRPRTVTPNDSITPWFRPADTTSLNGGLGKLAIPNGYVVGSAPNTYNPWVGGMGDQQQPIWLMDGLTSDLMQIYGGYINTGARNNDGTIRNSGQSLLGQRYSGTLFGLASLNSYATNARLPLSQYGQYRQASLTDSSVFDFYNHLIDGPNKKEWENWDAHNLSFSQTVWDNRLGFEVNYDRQKYRRGGENLIGNPTLNIDILQTLQDLSPNPNFGRPFVVAGPGGGNSYDSDRKYLRGSIFAEGRASDLFGRDSLLTKILGKHRLNGVSANEKYATENRRWQMYAHSQAWAGYWNRTDGSTSNITSDRPPLAMVYLGDSLAGANTASGAAIPGIANTIDLPDGNIYYFDSTWNANNTAYSAPWTVPASLSTIFDATATTQASNPANYVGWQSGFRENLLRYDNGKNTDLLTGAQKSLRVTRSYAGSWQGFLWNDSIIPTLGWRYDEVKSKGVTANPVTTNRGILNLDDSVYTLPGLYPGNQTFKDHSTSGGLVVHLNRLFGSHDVLPINVSLSYNMSRNFQVTDIRRDIYGSPIGNPTGKTKDYGVLLSTKDGRYSFRAVKYETTVSNATTQSNIVGLIGDSVRQGLRFRNVFLYQLSNYPWSSREQPQDRNTWAPAYVDANGAIVAAGNAATPPAGARLQTQAEADSMRDASIRAWNDIQTTLAAKGYFNYWGYTPTTATALTDRATYAANPAAYAPDPNTVYAYAYPAPQPQGLTLTSDTESKGYEFELTANPTNNWRISANASMTEATRANVGGALLDEFVAYMDEQMAGIAGEMRQFSGGWSASNLVRTNWNNARGNYALLKLQQGSSASELRKWRYNIVTNYSFSDGFLKGVGVGGSYRWQDKVIIGYPVLATSSTVANFDLSKPYYGPAEDAVDLWVSYERKLSPKLDWKIQLNVRNAFAKDGLIPISVQPDGQTWASVRVKPTQEWFVTNTFSF